MHDFLQNGTANRPIHDTAQSGRSDGPSLQVGTCRSQDATQECTARHEARLLLLVLLFLALLLLLFLLLKRMGRCGSDATSDICVPEKRIWVDLGKGVGN